jgi:O-antigen ligase
VNKSFNYILALLIILSVTLIPDIRLANNFPKLQLIDFLMPFIIGAIFFNRKSLVFHKLYGAIILFGIYIIFTILYNGRYQVFRDYFEVYKLIKFLIIIIYFTTISIDKLKQRVLYPAFIGLVVFNLLHYFNVFHFNILLEKYYNGGNHIKFFGLNTLGQPDIKRMVGTIGNSNNNAVLFMFFSVFFFPQKERNLKTIIPFFISILMVFLCQSRTSLVALFGFLLVVLLFNKENIKSFLILVSVIVGAYLSSFLISSNAYLETLFDGDLANNSSLRGRFESWMHLWEMIKEKPIVGYSPFKEYFYENKLYSENEYILMTWRYGIIGLLFYVVFLGFVFLKGIKNKLLNEGIQLAIITTVLAITALTNNPFSDRTLLVFFGITIGLLFNRIQENEKQ